MSPPVLKSHQPRRDYGSPVSNVLKNNNKNGNFNINSHTAAKFHIDLTLDSDSGTRDSDSDEPIFLGAQVAGGSQHQLQPKHQQQQHHLLHHHQQQQQPQHHHLQNHHPQHLSHPLSQPQSQSRLDFGQGLRGGPRPVNKRLFSDIQPPDIFALKGNNREAPDRRGATATAQHQNQNQAHQSPAAQHHFAAAPFSTAAAASASAASSHAAPGPSPAPSYPPPHSRFTPSSSKTQSPTLPNGSGGLGDLPKQQQQQQPQQPLSRYFIDSRSPSSRFPSSKSQSPLATAAAAAAAARRTPAAVTAHDQITVNTGSSDRPSTRDAQPVPQITPPSSSRLDVSLQESPSAVAMVKHSRTTPKRAEWSVEKLADALLEKSKDMRLAHRELVVFSLRSVQPIDNTVATGKDWFCGVKHDPVYNEVEKTSEMLKIRVKHHVRGKKEQGTHWYQPLLLKTEKPRVPKFRFHHKEIARNVLTPNTMLKFVPVIRDLRPGEDAQYNTWLKELDRMDASCGFRPMGSREDRVIRTTRQEKRAAVALFLDHWLKQLAVPECSRSTLIRHMVNQESDTEMTPHQKKVLDNLHSDNNAPTSPRAAKTARMFTEAFDSVFAGAHVPVERQITLRDVLLLDKTVDEVTESKKTVKNAPQDNTPQTYEGFLETYAIMGCLICFSNSCEHGDYGGFNEKRAFSLDANGRSEKMFIKAPGASDKKDHDGTRIEPCRRDCYMVRHDMPVRVEGLSPWSKTDEMLLKSMFSAVECSSRIRSKAQCMVAEILNRKCWEVQHHLSGLNVVVPEDTTEPLPRAKTLPWYDRHKKMLMGDWQSETFTHDHKSRISPDPCHHSGPCTAANGCECVLSNVLCERFCLCTAENCSHKFTGCACASTGKTCLQRAKEGRPCICVQLNRECDPGLCHGCGVRERVDPKNRDDPTLMDTGCQNCVLQRGQSKAVTPGKSQLEGCGYGLFAVEDIGQGEFVIEYTGELIMHDEGVRREARRGEAFDDEGNFTSYVFSLLDSEGIWVDAAIYGNHSRYINHEVDDFNVEPKILYVNGEYRIRFTATRNIAAGQELFFNYGGSFPNLTKKMIKDKTKETEDSNHQGSPVKRGPGRPRGKSKANKRGREPQAMRKEAPAPEAELSEELVELENAAPPAGRGRKRVREIDSVVEESDDYNPSFEEEEEDSSSRAQSQLLDPRSKRRRTRRALASEAAANGEPRASVENTDPEEPPQSAARRSRAQKRQRIVEDETPAEDEEPTPRRRRGRPPKRQIAVRTASPTPVPEEDEKGAEPEITPIRRGRTRQEQSKLELLERQENAVGDKAAREDAETESAEPQTPDHRSTRYGRRRSRRVAEESDDDEPAANGQRSPSIDESRSFSDMSNNSRSRRERRLPLRYRDSEEP